MNKNRNFKRILTIQDISCVGSCSITVALPIIAACGIEAAILPCAILSTHTGGFKDFVIHDMTDELASFLKHWQAEGLDFDAIYTGYLSNAAQIQAVQIAIDTLRSEGAPAIIDPAMADHGKLYYGFDENHVDSMRKLVGVSDYLLPNITEAAFLTSLEYRPEHDESYILSLLHGLRDIGAKKVILKGIVYDDARIGVAIYDALSDELDYYFTDKVDLKSHGTGDCFASVFTGCLVKGHDVQTSVRYAADFVVDSLEATIGDESHWYGVKFEQCLSTLARRAEQ